MVAPQRTESFALRCQKARERMEERKREQFHATDGFFADQNWRTLPDRLEVLCQALENSCQPVRIELTNEPAKIILI